MGSIIHLTFDGLSGGRAVPSSPRKESLGLTCLTRCTMWRSAALSISVTKSTGVDFDS